MVRNTYEVQNIGDLLREKRKQKKLDIKDVATNTKIRTEYLIALESGNYEKFASDVYAKGFLKKYAKFLGINPERAAAMFRRERKPKNKNIVQNTEYIRNRIGAPKLDLNWSKLVSFLIVIVILGFALYIFSRISDVIKEPELKISEPIEANAGDIKTFSTEKEEISIRGNLELGSRLKFNDADVNVNNYQQFEIADIPLKLGENNFNLVAANQFGQLSKISINIIRTPQVDSSDSDSDTANGSSTSDSDTDTTTDSFDKINALVKIKSQDAYIQVKVDGNVSFAQVLSVNEQKNFEATEEFIISSPRPSSIDLTVNNQNFELDNTREYKFSLTDDNKLLLSNL